MTELIEQLIEALRNELKEYGEMLALLDEQQEHLMSRRADSLLESVGRLNAQALVLRSVRAARESTQKSLAGMAGHPNCGSILTLAGFLAEDYRPLLQALVQENNQLLIRAQQRARQNHLMLGRALELMQQFINSLMPGNGATVYAGNGVLHTTTSSRNLYEALG